MSVADYGHDRSLVGYDGQPCVGLMGYCGTYPRPEAPRLRLVHSTPPAPPPEQTKYSTGLALVAPDGTRVPRKRGRPTTARLERACIICGKTFLCGRWEKTRLACSTACGHERRRRSLAAKEEMARREREERRERFIASTEGIPVEQRGEESARLSRVQREGIREGLRATRSNVETLLVRAKS